MELEVRSDFKLTLQLRSPAGRVQTIGTHTVRARSTDWDRRAIPHLHRLAPSGSWLASLDADRRVLELRRVSATRTGDPSQITIDRLRGPVRQFRWLASSRGVVIATADNVYIVRFDPARPAKRATAKPVFGKKPGKSFRVVDTRILPSGFFVRAAWDGPYGPQRRREQVYFVRVDSPRFERPVPVLPRGYASEGANVRSDGRIVVAVVSDPNLDDAPDVGEGQLWTFVVPAGRRPRLVERTPCPEGGCQVVNWTPETERLGIARDHGDIVLWPRAKSDHAKPLRLQLGSPEQESPIHALWANHDESRYLAAADRKLRLWNARGHVLYDWIPPGQRIIHSAEFQDDKVVVAAGLEVYELSRGRHRELVRVRGRYPESRGESGAVQEGDTEQSFVDAPVVLPDGSIAYAIVDLAEQARIVGD